jgi:hypothetical protein
VDEVHTRVGRQSVFVSGLAFLLLIASGIDLEYSIGGQLNPTFHDFAGEWIDEFDESKVFAEHNGSLLVWQNAHIVDTLPQLDVAIVHSAHFCQVDYKKVTLVAAEVGHLGVWVGYTRKYSVPLRVNGLYILECA